MIQLNPDYLIFQTSNGDQIPCSAQTATLELMGEMALAVEAEVVQNASAAVLHYFKHELKQDFVSVADFAEALEKVFRGLGIRLDTGRARGQIKVVEGDLHQMAQDAGEAWELFFFPHLRNELKRLAEQKPQVLRFRGLRECAKHLAKAPRWNRRCQTLSDQVVDYLRTCWTAEAVSPSCALVIV